MKTISESTTDPDSGVFYKGEHKKCFAYEAHTACGRHNFVMDVVVTSGNIHDSIAFDLFYRDYHKTFFCLFFLVMHEKARCRAFLSATRL